MRWEEKMRRAETVVVAVVIALLVVAFLISRAFGMPVHDGVQSLINLDTPGPFNEAVLKFLTGR
jgi:hypothetical protein